MRLVSSLVLVLAFGLGTTVANAQPGRADAEPTCVSQRIALQRQALTVTDLDRRGQLLAALPVCGPPILQAPEAPMTDAWTDVSHINGQLVPVGERNTYLVAAPRKVVIATNPVGWLVGVYGISASVALTDHVALRGNVEYFDYDFFGHTTGHELALSAPIYLRRAFSGPFIEPGVVYQETLDTPWDLFGDGDTTPIAHTFAGPEMLVGWHWTFDSGLSIATAIGVMRNTSTQVSTSMSTSTYDDSGDPMPTGYVRLGVAL